jgi:actin-related protein
VHHDFALLNGVKFRRHRFDAVRLDHNQKRDIDVCKDLYANIMLWGGSAMFIVVSKQIEKEITRRSECMDHLLGHGIACDLGWSSLTKMTMTRPICKHSRFDQL